MDAHHSRSTRDRPIGATSEPDFYTSFELSAILPGESMLHVEVRPCRTSPVGLGRAAPMPDLPTVGLGRARSSDAVRARAMAPIGRRVPSCLFPFLYSQVWDYSIFGDRMVGATTIDLEHRWYSRKWRRMNAYDEIKKETRTLMNPTSRLEQGTIVLKVLIGEYLITNYYDVGEYLITNYRASVIQVRDAARGLGAISASSRADLGPISGRSRADLGGITAHLRWRSSSVALLPARRWSS